MTLVPPVYELAPESVTVPAVVFVSAPPPARVAEMAPDWAATLAAVRVPLAIVPEDRVTAPTASVKAPRSSVPPATVTALLSPSWSTAP